MAKAKAAAEPAVVFKDRQAFLLASIRDPRRAFRVGEYYGLAKSEIEFRKALCATAFPTVERINRSDLQSWIAEAWQASQSKEPAEGESAEDGDEVDPADEESPTAVKAGESAADGVSRPGIR